eukprot:m.239529 g.239529  ORF g.239529 m.239529 type:complete len:280 (+) comp15817_c0_seq18:4000-4839(+)
MDARETESKRRRVDPTLGPRTFPAVRGNWPCSAVVPLAFDEDFPDAVSALVACLRAMLPKPHCDYITEVPLDALHVSVSRTVPLRQPMVAPLLEKFRATLSGIKSFDVTLDQLVLLGNESGTRRFVAAQVKTRSGSLHRILDQMDALFAVYQLPPYYEDRIMHVTLCSYPTASGIIATSAGSPPGEFATKEDLSGTTPAGIGVTVSDEIAAQEIAFETTRMPVRQLEPDDENVLSPEQLAELTRVFLAACEDGAIDTVVTANRVKCTAGNKTVKVMLPC